MHSKKYSLIIYNQPEKNKIINKIGSKHLERDLWCCFTGLLLYISLSTNACLMHLPWYCPESPCSSREGVVVWVHTMKPATFNCTVLRDGHHSLAATRMSTEQMLPIAPILDTMGFSALETWGGASIDAGLRFLGELPFERLNTLKKLAPTTPHMMLLRGQNMVGYTN